MPYEGKVEAVSAAAEKPMGHIGGDVWASKEMKADSKAWTNTDKLDQSKDLEFTDPYKDAGVANHAEEAHKNDVLNEKLEKNPEELEDQNGKEPLSKEKIEESLKNKVTEAEKLIALKLLKMKEHARAGKPDSLEKPVPPLKPEGRANCKPERGEKPPVDTRPEKPRPRKGKPIVPSDKPTPSEIHSRK